MVFQASAWPRSLGSWAMAARSRFSAASLLAMNWGSCKPWSMPVRAFREFWAPNRSSCASPLVLRTSQAELLQQDLAAANEVQRVGQTHVAQEFQRRHRGECDWCGRDCRTRTPVRSPAPRRRTTSESARSWPVGRSHRRGRCTHRDHSGGIRSCPRHHQKRRSLPPVPRPGGRRCIFCNDTDDNGRHRRESPRHCAARF